MPACKQSEKFAEPNTSVRANSARVRFDFEGALALARKLWAMADELERSKVTRTKSAATAKTVWRGAYADQFAVRMTDEDTSRANVVNSLRKEAEEWATSWANAMNEQNRRNRAKAVDAEREQRSGEEKFGDFFVGDDSDEQVAKVGDATPPKGPSFTPTMTEATF